MKTSDFDYYLPERLIAQTPLARRENSRLLAYDISNDKTVHDNFFNIQNYLKKGDLLCINNTRVLPARLYGKTENGGAMEFLLLKRIQGDTWEVLVKPGKKARIGAGITFSPKLSAKVTGMGQDGTRIADFFYQGNFENLLQQTGEMPLPHYIKQKLDDGERYQTVYSQHIGSAAAPTAGLHFTPDLMQRLENCGINFARVLLHVGLGTFRPVKTEDISQHKMHSEYFEVSEKAAQQINDAKRQGRRVIAVGTTTVRVLESIADEKGFVKSCKGETDIFIYPGYKLKCVDALITNFHLPRSTLIMLVSAFAGRENTLKLYNEAVKEQYRFYSLGDAMLLY
ncbi:MAG: tRNA preQ1(34) S-adenosylmethionine ribosyltransferase-isomerase QueA [Clostridia bacterium]|nr:tRNA preQ1(34) S-adenosylmethionine ribosyltransferase-isomerase QueA [Clostridia bacterium]